MVVLKGLKNIKLEVCYSNRKPRNAKLRKETLERDNYTCQKCGLDEFPDSLQAHHITLVMHCGVDHISNMITLCSECHPYAPDHPYKFFKWIKKQHRCVTSAPAIIRIFAGHLKRACGGFLLCDKKDITELEVKYLNKILPLLNPNYKKCWRYRNSTPIWEKDNLNDLFNLKEVTDYVFCKLYDEGELMIQIPKIKGRLNLKMLKIEAEKLRQENPKISYRKLGKIFQVTHATIKKVLID